MQATLFELVDKMTDEDCFEEFLLMKTNFENENLADESSKKKTFRPPRLSEENFEKLKKSVSYLTLKEE